MPGYIEISIQDDISKELGQFEKEAPKLLDAVIRDTARKYRDFVRRKYLSGQMLKKRTGRAWKAVRVYKKRGQPHTFVITGGRLANIYEHPGGVTIRPKGERLRQAVAGATGRAVRRRGARPRVLVWKDKGRFVAARTVHLAPRPFMSASAAAFDFGAALGQSTEKIVGREIRKRGLSGG